MDFSISKNQEQLRREIVSFCERTISSDEIDGAAIDALWKTFAAAGLAALPVDQRYGGKGLDPVSSIIALEALGYGSRDGGFNFSLCAHLLACVIPLNKFGNNRQKEEYL